MGISKEETGKKTESVTHTWQSVGSVPFPQKIHGSVPFPQKIHIKNTL
jgi:hypothetical protein